jgi:hypothetical protein
VTGKRQVTPSFSDGVGAMRVMELWRAREPVPLGGASRTS